jgi:hypothetical protein
MILEVVLITKKRRHFAFDRYSGRGDRSRTCFLGFGDRCMAVLLLPYSALPLYQRARSHAIKHPVQIWRHYGYNRVEVHYVYTIFRVSCWMAKSSW